jgi:hypothetical protein
MTNLLWVAILSAALGVSPAERTESKSVTVSSAGPCGAEAQAERLHPDWNVVKVRPAEPGKVTNAEWVVTLSRVTMVVTIQSARKCAALGEAERRNPGWEWVEVSPAEPGKTMNTAWVVTLKRN